MNVPAQRLGFPRCVRGLVRREMRRGNEGCVQQGLVFILPAVSRRSKRIGRFQFVPNALLFQLAFGFQPKMVLAATRLSGLLPQFVGAFTYLLLIYWHAILAD